MFPRLPRHRCGARPRCHTISRSCLMQLHPWPAPTRNAASLTKEQCAMRGVQTLLAELYPCTATYSTCPTDGTNSVDRVSLFTYPNITIDTQKNEYCGASGNP